MIKDTLQTVLQMLKSSDYYRNSSGEMKLAVEKVLKSDESTIKTKMTTCSEPFKLILSIDILMSLRFDDATPAKLEVKYQCIANLSDFIPETLVVREFRHLKQSLKKQIFNSTFPWEIFSACRSVIIDVLRILAKYRKLESILSNERLARFCSIKQAINSIIIILSQGEASADDFIRIIQQCIPKKVKYLIKLKRVLETLPHSDKIPQLVEFLNISIGELSSRPSSSGLESVCTELDKNLEKIIMNDAINPVEVNISPGRCITVPQLKISNLIKDTSKELLASCLQEYTETLVMTYPTFDSLFGTMLYQITEALTRPEILACFFKRKEVISLKFKFFKHYRVLRDLPINVSSTIMNLMLSLGNPTNRSSIIKYFVKKVKPSISYYALSISTAERLYNLLSSNLLHSILLRNNIVSPEVNLTLELQKIVPTITVMKLPRGTTGLTLKTQHISIKRFSTINQSFADGALFVILVHELGHYLKRIHCTTVRETSIAFSPNLPGSPTEGGYFVEECFFGQIMNLITLDQADFLLAGNYPAEESEFHTKIKELGNVSTRNPSKVLRKDCSSLYIGMCGSFYGL